MGSTSTAMLETTAASPILLQPQVYLKVENLSLAFGGQNVLRGVNLDLAGGMIALLRGDNGAGKTTLLNVLSGFLKPDTGTASLEINHKRVDILKETPDCLARLGLIARLWQEVKLFPTMTVLENVLIASPNALGINPLHVFFSPLRVRQQEREFRAQALAWLDMLGIADRADSSGDKLSVGQTKRVAIARMLQTGARVMLLDEPLAGLDVQTSEKLVKDLERLADITHRAILIVEHKHDMILPICDVVYTLENGMVERQNSEAK